MDSDLEAFERARADRMTRTDPSTHTWVRMQGKVLRLSKDNHPFLDADGNPIYDDAEGPLVPAPDSPHTTRLREKGTPAAPGARHKGVAADLARAYVDAHPEMETLYGGLTIDQLVEAVDNARLAGDEEKRIRIDAWLMAKFAPFSVSGYARF